MCSLVHYSFSLIAALSKDDLTAMSSVLDKLPSDESRREIILSISENLDYCKSKEAVQLILKYVDMKDLRKCLVDGWREYGWIPNNLVKDNASHIMIR